MFAKVKILDVLRNVEKNFQYRVSMITRYKNLVHDLVHSYIYLMPFDIPYNQKQQILLSSENLCTNLDVTFHFSFLNF